MRYFSVLRNLRWVLILNGFQWLIFSDYLYAMAPKRPGLNTKGNVDRKVVVMSNGSSPHDRYFWHKVYPKEGIPCKGDIILVPGYAANFSSFDLPGEADSTAVLLAEAGYRVHGYSSRMDPRLEKKKDHPDNAPGPRPAEWDLETVLSDLFQMAEILKKETGKNPVIGGWSRGAQITLAAANARPELFSGLGIWEGVMFSEDPKIRTNSLRHAEQLQRQRSKGLKDVGPHRYRVHVGSFIEGKTPEVSFVEAITSPLPDTATLPGFQMFACDGEGKPLSCLNLLTKCFVTLNQYDSLELNTDIWESVAGKKDHTSNLGNFRGPVLVFSAGKGMGPYMGDTLNFLNNAKFTHYHEPDFGNGDFIYHPNHRELFEDRVIAWLDKINF